MADYYIENGLYVFTEKFHLKRGYCCKSACRHCPYGFKNEINEEKIAQNSSQKSRKSNKKKI